MPARLTLNTGFHVGPIDRRIFGGFLEHLGRAVYGGIYDPGNARSDAQGLRLDVLEALGRLRMPVVRYPGGNYVSVYDWKDTVGPRSARPRRPDYAWQSVETNQFGIGEFMSWCEALGTAPFLAVNLGTGDPAEAAHLVEYTNLAAGTRWSDLRVANGRAAPYAVQLWGLGNELDGPWQAGHVPAEVYARRAFQSSFLMKQLDPSIETVAAGSSGRNMSTYLAWDREVLETGWDTIDYISAHRYSTNAAGDTPAYLADGVEVDRVLSDYASVIGYVRGLRRSNKHVYLAFDEWNVWYRARQGEHTRGGWREAPPLLEEHYNLEDAVVVAQYLAAFLRRADLVKVACLAQIVNAIAPVLTRPEGILLQTIFHPFALFAEHARGRSLTPRIASPEYATSAYGAVPVLDAASTFDPESGTVAAFLINRSLEPLSVEVGLEDRRVAAAPQAVVFGGGSVSLENTWEVPERVRPRAGRVELNETGCRIEVPGPGMAVVTLATSSR